MKIALLIDDRYPHAGGTARVCQVIGQHLSSLGHRVKIFCPRGSFSDGIDIHVVRTLRLAPLPEGTLMPSRADKAALRAFAPNIIHTHTDRGAFLWAQQWRNQRAAPHIHTFHADYSVLHAHYKAAAVLSLLSRLETSRLRKDVTIPAAVNNYYAATDKFLKLDWYNIARLAANVDFYTTPSPRLFHFFQTVGLSQHGQLLPFGVDAEWYIPKEQLQRRSRKVPTILSLGRLTPEKRVDVIIEAFRLLREQGTAAKLAIVGGGNAKAELQAQAARSGFANDITFYGRIDETARLIEHYRQSDIFALSSYHYETQGLVLLEAAASGLPIVYCDERLTVGVTAKNSLLVQPDAASFAEAFRRLCENEDQRQQMALASLAEAERYPLNGFLESLLETYQRFNQKR